MLGQWGAWAPLPLLKSATDLNGVTLITTVKTYLEFKKIIRQFSYIPNSEHLEYLVINTFNKLIGRKPILRF